jgi:hypothetical protein
MGFLICNKCDGSYELQPGESPEDFDLACECGGKLVHFKNQDENEESNPKNSKAVDTKFCFNCGTKISLKSKKCSECGAILPVNIDSQKDTNKSRYKKKRPGLAVLYSLLILGLGQVYNGTKAQRSYTFYFSS